MTDRHIGFLAVAVFAAALAPVGDSLFAALLVASGAAVAWLARRPLALIVLCGFTASLSAGAAWGAIEPVHPAVVFGDITLVSDPEPTRGGVRAMADVDGRRVQLTAWSSSAGHLRPRLMGEVITAEVRLRPLTNPPKWLLAQGLEGRGTVADVAGWTEGSAHTRLANSLRRTIESGARSMTRSERSLFTGLVYGDDRQQQPLVTDNFKAVGLTHILAVSGQNVAFVLAIAGPVLRRFGFRGRFAITLAVLLLFATVTRFEPSVVRASVMTSVAAVGALVGTEVPSRRVLALAVAGLVLIDPLLVHSVAFQLSVAASAGILLWSGRVARAIPGPRPFAEAIAVTSSAQLAVSPLLIWLFDGVPVASLPANIIGGPAAGPVMMWGLTGGWLAGVVPGWLATVLHMPTRAALWWIDRTADTLARLPLGELDGFHLVVLFAAGWFGLRQQHTTGRVATVVVMLVVLASPAAMPPVSGPIVDVDGRSFAIRDQGRTVLVVDASTRPDAMLESLRRARVGELDTVVSLHGSRGAQSLLDIVGERHEIGRVLAPDVHRIVGARPIVASSTVAAGSISIEIQPDGKLLRVVLDPG